ncbi:GNAT family N-acetyltransferase [Chitinimonas sp. BJB300]|uniref:GNAT family N-acetyltransferase n=1 Tax=Chitinimonas sp. BJB300 TaxID=1559339 RepID=UPI000C11B234|nr:GNAT family protein [Chitinimonas sp. BJB300]PHV10478.1 GNAT family N-acetyltransferase [Chitinimonas sp. BJB300]TSJ87121.1 GNAT family N-acetyltransferase [Chitinimonas sp. BJB300]
MTFPTLHTPRLTLRELVPSDAAAVLGIHGNPEVMRWFGSDPVKNQDEALRLIEAFAGWRKLPAPGTRWGICLNETGELIGSCGLFKWNRSWRNCTLGYELARSAWGLGFMNEALQAALDYGFAEMDLHRVQAEIHPDNLSSIKQVLKLGFQPEGCHREQGYWAGQFHDLNCYSLLAREWSTINYAN